MGQLMRDPAPKEQLEALVASLALVASDREHGASWLALQATQALADASVLPPSPTFTGADVEARLAQLRLAAQRFADARPSMAAIANSVAQTWRASVFDAQGAAIGDDPLLRLRALHDGAMLALGAWATAGAAITQAIADLLPPDATIYTHSRSSTVEQSLRWLAQAGRVRRVIVAESRPGGEGIALARALAASEAARDGGLLVTLAADTASGLLMREADAVIVGADSVRADGAVVNKVGTYPLALMARAEGKLFYALCETLKIAAPDWPLILEAGDSADLAPETIPGVTTAVTLFDHTPATYCRAIVTERGALDGAAIARYANDAAAALRLLGGAPPDGRAAAIREGL